MVKLSKMGEDGITMRNCMIEALWEDCEKRIKLLGVSQVVTERCRLN